MSPYSTPWWYSREKGKLGDIEAGHMPAEAAYYTASALVDGFSYTRLSLGSRIQAAQFGPTTLIWIPDGKPGNVVVTPKGEAPFVQVDVVGRVKELKGEGNGSVSVAVGDSPVYILSRKTYGELTKF